MNKTFKIVFNKARGALMVANEITGAVQKKGVKLVVASALFVTAGCASATTLLNTTTEVGAGDYSVDISAGNTVTINAKDGNVSLTKILMGRWLLKAHPV